MFSDLQIQCDPSLGEKIIVTSTYMADRIRFMLADSNYLILTTAREDDEVVRMGPKLFHELEHYLEQLSEFIEDS